MSSSSSNISTSFDPQIYFYVAVENWIYGTTSLLSLLSLIWVLALRNSLGVSPRHALFFILGAINWLIFNIFNLPNMFQPLLSDDNWWNSDEGVLANRIIYTIGDNSYFLALGFYQIAAMYR